MGSLRASLDRRMAHLPSARDIDLMYGLEPVFEPGRDARLQPLLQAHVAQCPWCWQSWAPVFETAAGSECRIEDCPHCCGPVQLDLRVEADGHASLQALRAD